MDITPLQQKRKQKYLTVALIAVLSAVALILWQGISKKEEGPTMPVSEKEEVLAPKIKINMAILESPILKKLRLFEGIPAFEGKAGRENPFTPY